jgi:ESS family glutamate:Na+ symporter
MAAATFGLISGSIIGGPVARFLITRKNLKPVAEDNLDLEIAEMDLEAAEWEPARGDDVMRSVFQITLCMSIGVILYDFFGKFGVKVPTYLFSLFMGIIVRNAAEYTGWYRVNVRYVETMGATSLSLFLAMALMSLKLWHLVELAVPMLIILSGQVVLMIFFAIFVTFRFCGRDYDAAVLCGGHCGFGLGATPNAIANMQAITDKYGPAPRAYFLVSIVGAVFIDIVNAMVIQAFVPLMLK